MKSKLSSSAPAAREPFAASRRTFLRGLRRFARTLAQFTEVFAATPFPAPELVRRFHRFARLFREFLQTFHSFAEASSHLLERARYPKLQR